MLIYSPIVLALSIHIAVVYAYLYLLFTTITDVFEENYGFSQGSVGLTYLGIGAGSLAGVIIFGFESDRTMKKKSALGEMKPEYRLPLMIPGSFAIPIGRIISLPPDSHKKLKANLWGLVFIYGWTAQNHVFWIAPIIGTSLGTSSTFRNY